MIMKWKSGDLMTKKDEVLKFLEDNSLEGVFVLKDENCRYLSNFTGSDSFLFLTKKNFYLLTDHRYIEQAKKEAEGFEVVNYAGKLAESIARLSQKENIKTVGLEEIITHKMYLSFARAYTGAKFTICKIDRLRQIKSAEELNFLREACRISDIAFEKTVPHIRAGITEARLRTILECAMLEAGSEGKSFDTIVASGERSAYPHGTATEKIIKEGDLVTFDFGAIYNGYHSDITRTVAVGSISEQKRYIYDAVLGCNEYIETLLKAGVICSDMDREARNYLKKFELDSYFIHALGHSVGLEIHEAPILSPHDHTVLEIGMTETVEPGVYIPGIGGVRIEDTVVINKDNIEVLTKFSKNFLRV